MNTHATGQVQSCHHYPNRVLQKRDLAAELGGVCEKTVDNLIKAGKLPQPCWLNSIPVWMLHDVHAFISRHAGIERPTAADESAAHQNATGEKQGTGKGRGTARGSKSKAGKYDV